MQNDSVLRLNRLLLVALQIQNHHPQFGRKLALQGAGESLSHADQRVRSREDAGASEKERLRRACAARVL